MFSLDLGLEFILLVDDFLVPVASLSLLLLPRLSLSEAAASSPTPGYRDGAGGPCSQVLSQRCQPPDPIPPWPPSTHPIHTFLSNSPLSSLLLNLDRIALISSAICCITHLLPDEVGVTEPTPRGAPQRPGGPGRAGRSPLSQGSELHIVSDYLGEKWEETQGSWLVSQCQIP